MMYIVKFLIIGVGVVFIYLAIGFFLKGFFIAKEDIDDNNMLWFGLCWPVSFFIYGAVYIMFKFTDLGKTARKKLRSKKKK